MDQNRSDRLSEDTGIVALDTRFKAALQRERVVHDPTVDLSKLRPEGSKRPRIAIIGGGWNSAIVAMALDINADVTIYELNRDKFGRGQVAQKHFTNLPIRLILGK